MTARAALSILMLTLAMVPGVLFPQATPSARWLTDRPCSEALSRERFRVAPVEVRTPPSRSCREKRCAHLRNGGEVCQCLTDSTRTISVREVGSRAIEFISPSSDVRPDSFDVVEADLDGDRESELVVARLDAVGNGMGVAHWTVFALMPGRYDWTVDSISVDDYSSVGSWIAIRGEQSCNLLATQWVNGFEPARGGGLYLEASWQAFESGHFVQRVDRPIIRRRLLFSFDRQRVDSTIRDAPWAWVRSASTH